MATALAATYTATETVPVPPASAYQGSGGGDGWAVALSPTAVYNVFHHDSSLEVACHLQADASACSNGQPVTDTAGNDFATSGQPGLWLNQGTGKLYVFVTRTSDSTAGVVCVDTSQLMTGTPFCGFTALTAPGDATMASGISNVSDLATVGSKLYAFNYVPGAGVSGSQNKLMCFDTTTLAACAGQPYAVAVGSGADLDSSWPPPEVTAIGGRVIVPATNDNNELACYDPKTGTDCSGQWPVALPGPYAGDYGSAFPVLNTSGSAVGLCLPDGTDECFDLNGIALATPSNLPGAIPASDGWNGPAVVLGQRVYVPNGNTDEIHCFDYGSGAGCSGFPLSFSNLGYLYTVNEDPQRPGCLWVNADNGGSQIQDFDAYTGGQCGQGPIRVLSSSIIGSTAACVPNGFSTLQVLSPSPGSYTSGTVDFADATGAPLSSIGTQPLDSSGKATLSGLDFSAAPLPQFLIALNGAGTTPTAVTVRLTWTTSGSYRPGCVRGGTYVALGDSYSSGEGNPPFFAATSRTSSPVDVCHRSIGAYPELLLGDPNVPPSLQHWACSGAIIPDFYPKQPNTAYNTSGGQWGEGPQLSRLNDSTTLVTVSVGGNDVGFADVLSDCVYGLGAPGNPGCAARDDQEVRTAIVGLTTGSSGFCLPSFNSLPPACYPSAASLHQLYADIHARAPHARIVVLGYPELFTQNPTRPCVVLRAPLAYNVSAADMKWMNLMALFLDNTILREVKRAQGNGVPATYVDTTAAFTGHGLCDSTSWINAVSLTFTQVSPAGASFGLGPSQYSFHPNAAGQREFATLIRRVVG